METIKLSTNYLIRSDEVQLFANVEEQSGRISLEAHRGGNNFVFKMSSPKKVKKIGECLIEAAKLGEMVERGKRDIPF